MGFTRLHKGSMTPHFTFEETGAQKMLIRHGEVTVMQQKVLDSESEDLSLHLSSAFY